MRNYGSRLARLEKAIIPPQPVRISIVYVDGDDWRDGASGGGRHIKLNWGDVGERNQEDDDMKHDRRLAKLEDRVFAAQKAAMARLDTDDLHTFVAAFDRMFTPGCDTTPEEQAVKARWLQLVHEQIHPADPLQAKLAERLRQAPPPALLESLQDDTPAPSTGADSQPGAAGQQPARAAAPGETTPPAEPPPWNYQMAKWTYHEPEPGPNLRKLRQMARQSRR